MRTLLHKPDSEGVGETFLVTFRAFESIPTVTVDLIGLALTAATVTFLYKRRQAALTSRMAFLSRLGHLRGGSGRTRYPL